MGKKLTCKEKPDVLLGWPQRHSMGDRCYYRCQRPAWSVQEPKAGSEVEVSWLPSSAQTDSNSAAENMELSRTLHVLAVLDRNGGHITVQDVIKLMNARSSISTAWPSVTCKCLSLQSSSNSLKTGFGIFVWHVTKKWFEGSRFLLFVCSVFILLWAVCHGFERERKGEKHWFKREASIGCFLYVPKPEIAPPGWGIKPTT